MLRCSECHLANVCFGPEADFGRYAANDRIEPKADIHGILECSAATSLTEMLLTIVFLINFKTVGSREPCGQRCLLSARGKQKCASSNSSQQDLEPNAHKSFQALNTCSLW